MLARVDATVSTQLSLSCHVRNYMSLARLCLIYEVKKVGVPCATTIVMLQVTFLGILCIIFEI
jgi:hypothetical protein